MMIVDLTILTLMAFACWKAYRYRQDWLFAIHSLLVWLLQGKGAGQQLLRIAPLIVAWLMLCHWVNTHGWHATAAAGILWAMTIGLNEMRVIEEEQKLKVNS